jgi:CubicO group peptidase (beta-lactamase class C family)
MRRTETRRRRWGLAAVVLAGAAVACSPDGRSGAGPGSTDSTATATDEDDVTYPGDEWATVDPATAGFDPAALGRLDEAAAAAGSTCLVVTRDGAVVDERYWQGSTADTPREAFSVTKSLTSTLVGIAQDADRLELDDPAADYLPEWRGTTSEAVTVENLVRNDSGRHWDLATDYRDMAIGASDKTAFALALGQDAPPGDVWAYNNSAIQTLSAVLETATGEDPIDYARTHLFEPLGMADSTLTTDAAGNALTFMGLRTTCLDLARFGYLMLRDGVWDGEQVVSSDYVEQATGRSSTELNAAYGLLWWLNREGTIATPALATTGIDDWSGATRGQLVPGAPDDAFWALGFRNQIVAVIPSEGIVAVRMGAAPPPGAPFTQAELTVGVLDAVVDP